jgi:hypothetical protein
MTSTNIFVNKYQLNTKLQDKFLRIHTFNSTEANNIFNLNYQLYFDAYGNVAVETPEKLLLVNYINPMATNKPMIFNNPANKVDPDKRIDENKNPYNIVFSPNLLWILYKVVITQQEAQNSSTPIDPGTYCYLLFNFFHTEDYKNYYKIRKDDAMNLFHDYCVKTSDLDPTCSCLPVNGDICAARLLPKAMIDARKGSSAYNAFTTVCQHTEKGCQTITSYPDSFLNQYYIDYPRPPSVNVVLCAQTFSAGRDISINKGDVEQQCKITGDNSIGAVIEERITNKPFTGTTPPIVQPPPSDGESGDISFLDRYFNYSAYKTAYGILGIVIILAVFGSLGYYYWKKNKKTESSSQNPTPTSTLES